MAYSKTTWTDNEAPYLNATNLNKIETGIYNNSVELDSVVDYGDAIEDNADAIENNKASILNNQSNISNNSERIDENADAIAENADNIDTNADNIAINAGNILGLSVGEVYQGTWTPQAGTEYPASPEGGWSYYIQFLDDDGYTFTTGDLTGRVANNSDKIIYNGTAWSMLDNTSEQLGYYLVDDIESMLSLSPLHGALCETYGYYEANDGGGGSFNYDADLSGTNDGGSILNGWVRQYDNTLNVKHFGAKGDGVTDDTVNIQAAIDASYGKVLAVPEGEFMISSTVYIREALTILGVANGSVFKAALDKSTDINLFDTGSDDAPDRTIDGLVIDGVTFDGNFLPVGRWLQQWSDNTTAITDPENDYADNGGGIGNTDAEYIADSDYLATSQVATGGVAISLVNTTMPTTQTTSSATPYECARRVRVSSVVDETASRFTVVGTDYSGDAQTEEIQGVDSGIAEGQEWFLTVTSVTANVTTASTVTVGIEEFDIGSTMSANRRNPDYTTVSNLLRIVATENTTIIRCIFKDHYGRAILEAGGLNVTISSNWLTYIGKDDGPFHAIWTSAHGNPEAPTSTFLDSEDIKILNNRADNLERSFILFAPTKGGTLSGNYIDGWGESCFFIPDNLHYNGGSSVISNNSMKHGTLTDIAGQGMEMNSSRNVAIYGNYIEDSAEEGISALGTDGVTYAQNIFKNCCNATTTPYGPYSERYGYAVGSDPIAGDPIDITQKSFMKIGTIGENGMDNTIITANIFNEDRVTHPYVFAQTKSGSNRASKRCSIIGNTLNVPEDMLFLNTSIDGVWDTVMALKIKDNYNHVSEAPVRVDGTITSGVTGIQTINVGFRPSMIHIHATSNNVNDGIAWIGTTNWNSSGTPPDQGTEFGIGDDGYLITNTLNELIRLIDDTNTIRVSVEFGEWEEEGFTFNIISNSLTFRYRFICIP